MPLELHIVCWRIENTVSPHYRLFEKPVSSLKKTCLPHPLHTCKICISNNFQMISLNPSLHFFVIFDMLPSSPPIFLLLFLFCTCLVHLLLSFSFVFADRHPFLILYVSFSSPSFFFIRFRHRHPFPILYVCFPSSQLSLLVLPVVILFLFCTCIPVATPFLFPPPFYP